ncbi:MAG: adenylate/guanylate cyclase domain-containing protein [Deltaproteobacteria bacterium]|nr:adenylate/guanylate cyclase domain-containing protein [Deltaproteobacteria bacterium]
MTEVKSGGAKETFTGKVLSGLGIGLLTSIIMGGLLMIGTFEVPELMVFDVMQRLAADPDEADRDILLLTIDQGSLEKVEKSMGHSYPWPRSLHALILGYIEKGIPRAVIFDLFFEGRSSGGEEEDRAEMDIEFAEAINESGRVVLGVKLRPGDPTPKSADAGKLLNSARLANKPWPGLEKFDRIDPLAHEICRARARFGFVNAVPEGDGIIRRTGLLANVDGNMVPSLGLAALMFDDLVEAGSAERDLKIAGNSIPIALDGRVWIRFHGPGGIEQGQGRTYEYLPIFNVLKSAIQAEQGIEPLLAPDVFKDKWVIVGSTASSAFDLRATPFSKESNFPGMEIHATILDNLLNNGFLTRLPRWVVLLLVIVACLIVGIGGRIIKSLLWGTITVLGGLAGYALISLAAFQAGVMVDLVAVAAAIFTTSACISYANFLRERRSKQHIRNIFQYYLDPSVVEQLIETPETLGLGGEARVCTVFFSDIVGFTSIAEKLTPHQLVEMMNRYLGEMTEIVIQHGGFLDKYIGDAIMAVFGAPADLPEHAQAACRAALESHQHLSKLNHEFTRLNIPQLKCGIGINTGSMVVGNVGSATRGNYTAMGDAVNLASRLEALNRSFKTRTIIGPETFEILRDQFVCRELDFIRVKGKLEPIRAYELVGESQNIDPQTLKLFEEFSQALSTYREGRWLEAKKLFECIHETYPQDGPTGVYVERCRAYAAEPPDQDWNGVFVMTKK